jgi:hypothetical protein
VEPDPRAKKLRESARKLAVAKARMEKAKREADALSLIANAYAGHRAKERKKNEEGTTG